MTEARLVHHCCWPSIAKHPHSITTAVPFTYLGPARGHWACGPVQHVILYHAAQLSLLFLSTLRANQSNEHPHIHSRGCWLMCGCNQIVWFFFSTRSNIFRVFMHHFFQPVFPRIASILRLSSHLRHLLPSLLFAIYDMPPLHPLNLSVWSAVWRNSITHLICLAKCFLPSDCRSDASWRPCEYQKKKKKPPSRGLNESYVRRNDHPDTLTHKSAIINIDSCVALQKSMLRLYSQELTKSTGPIFSKSWSPGLRYSRLSGL